MKKFNIDYLLFFICLFFLNTKCYTLKLEVKDSKPDQQYHLSNTKYKENIYKNGLNSVLQGLGLSEIDYNAAFN